jgi:fructose-1,6-bisphosphatase/inositol monophosphatase family enzyme
MSLPTSDEVLVVLGRATRAVELALAANTDWTLSGGRGSQYNHDLVADAAALPILLDAGFGVLSEESGDHFVDRDIVVAIDPVDGSTNAGRNIPWWAISLCAIDADGPLASVCATQTDRTGNGRWFEAMRGRGATFQGAPCAPRDTIDPSRAVVAASDGTADLYLDVAQVRLFGSCVVDMCAVAAGWLDAACDVTKHGMHVWDYAGAWLICKEAGVALVEREGQTSNWLDRTQTRSWIAGATPQLAEELAKRCAAIVREHGAAGEWRYEDGRVGTYDA